MPSTSSCALFSLQKVFLVAECLLRISIVDRIKKSFVMCATLGSETGLHLHHRKVFSFTAAPAMGNRMAKWRICDGCCQNECYDDFQ